MSQSSCSYTSSYTTLILHLKMFSSRKIIAVELIKFVAVQMYNFFFAFQLVYMRARNMRNNIKTSGHIKIRRDAAIAIKMDAGKFVGDETCCMFRNIIALHASYPPPVKK